jgi:uncharacterized repeat protein (TIGR01451 family)
MKRAESLEILSSTVAELVALAPDWESTDCQSWKLRAERAFGRAFGEQHALTKEMSAVIFFPEDLTRNRWTPEICAAAFEKGRKRALAILSAAREEIEAAPTAPQRKNDDEKPAKRRRWNWTKIGALAAVAAVVLGVPTAVAVVGGWFDGGRPQEPATGIVSANGYPGDGAVTITSTTMSTNSTGDTYPKYALTVCLTGRPARQTIEPWTDAVTVNVGDTIDWLVEARNTGSLVLRDVTVLVELPQGLEVWPGSFQLISGSHPSTNPYGFPDTAIQTVTGKAQINVGIGDYAPVSNGFLVFSTKVVSKPDSSGEVGHSFTVSAYVTPEGLQTVNDEVEVNVEAQAPSG